MSLVGLVGGAGQGVGPQGLESVAGAFEGVDLGVVDDAVDYGRGDGDVAENLAPAGVGQV